MENANRLSPKHKRIKDYNLCFYGHDFKEVQLPNEEAYKQLVGFLKEYYMQISPLVESGKWLWSGLIEKMRRSAFCVFETKSGNRNVHIELGYALAHGLNVILLIPQGNDNSYQKYLPSDLSGLVQIRYNGAKDLLSKLKSEVPKRFYSVEERLSLNLHNISVTNKVYFQLIIEKPKITFSELVSEACSIETVSSNNISLSDFLKVYDEALVVAETDHWDQTTISIDKDYRESICKKLGIQIKGDGI